MQLTPQQQRDFARDGYLCLKGVFRSAEIAALTRAAGTLPQAPSTMAYLYEIRDSWASRAACSESHWSTFSTHIFRSFRFRLTSRFSEDTCTTTPKERPKTFSTG